jgi:hypothetical protein
MGLLDLKTDLKSLKYGKDRPGGGDSGQPYIQSDINSNIQTIGVNDDGRIRGGATGAKNASTTDLLRIKRFINSKPKGNLFLTNQIGLQFSNPRLETRKISLGNGTGILGFINRAVNAISSNFGPTRIYNLGINTLAQVPVTAYGIHFNRHGLLPAQDDNTKYFAVVQSNNDKDQNVKNPTNRLASLRTKFQLGVREPGANFNDTPLITGAQQLLRTLNPIARSIGGLIGGRVGRAINNVSRLSSLFFNNNDLTIDNYLGGPGSTFGVGKTLIRRYDITEKGERIDNAFEKSKLVARSAKINWDLALGGAYPFSKPNQSSPTNLAISLDNKTEIKNPNVENQNVIKGLNAVSPAAKEYSKLKTALDAIQNIEQVIPFSTVKNNNYNGKDYGPFKEKTFTTKPNSGLDRTAPDFKYYGERGTNKDGSQAWYKNTDLFSRKDADIMTIAFSAVDPFNPLSDDPNRRHFFSAYMKGFKDDFNATWNDINYAGRAESFYVYNKFKRTVSFNLQIPCFNRKELFEKHRNLGQMAATTAGTYNEDGFLGGVLIKLNVGNYLVGEYGILNSLNYSIPDDASWDVTPEGRLAMLIDASFNFTIIHKELPQYKTDGGFFKYLPNKLQGFLPSITNPSEWVYDNYEKDKFQDTITPNAVIKLRQPNPEFVRPEITSALLPPPFGFKNQPVTQLNTTVLPTQSPTRITDTRGNQAGVITDTRNQTFRFGNSGG